MKTANNDFSLKASGSGVALWRIAEALGITDATFSRKLRHELPEETKAKIYRIIDELKEVE